MKSLLSIIWPAICLIICILENWYLAALVFVGACGGVMYMAYLFAEGIKYGTIVCPDHEAGDPYNQLGDDETSLED